MWRRSRPEHFLLQLLRVGQVAVVAEDDAERRGDMKGCASAKL